MDKLLHIPLGTDVGIEPPHDQCRRQAEGCLRWQGTGVDVRNDQACQPTHLAGQVKARRHRVTSPPGVVIRQQPKTPRERKLDEVFFCSRNFATHDGAEPTQQHQQAN